jgi:hypothetical protein
VGYDGQVAIGDSSTVVSGDFEIQSTLKPEAGRTMQSLGYVYTCEQTGPPSAFTSGAPVSAACEDIYLLPGTTYFRVEPDPSTSSLPGQVVTRTPTGNWSVTGAATGLPYECLENIYYVPAPADLKLRISTETFALPSGVVPAYRFRIRIQCFFDGVQVYRFLPCPDTQALSGALASDRRFAVLFSNVDLAVDADTGENRLGAPSGSVQSYVTDLPSSLSIPLTPDGLPDASNAGTRMSYTDQNWITTYDPLQPGTLEVDARSTYAIEKSRPFVISFMMPSFPMIVQRPRRVYGWVALYMAGGFVNAGTSASIEVTSAGGNSSKSVVVPITGDFDSADYSTYLKVGEASVDISDAEFVDNGLTGTVVLDESAVSGTTWPVGTDIPDPYMPEPVIYSTSSAAFARYNGACYYNDGPVETDPGADLRPMTEDITSCSDPEGSATVGGVGMYCYGEVNGKGTLLVPQPMYNPALYVAPVSQATHCYCNPCLVTPWANPVPAFTPFVSYDDKSFCGIPWRYDPCEGSATSLIIPYAVGAVPHETVALDGNCYSNRGVSKDTTGCRVVKLTDVAVAYDCQDALCFTPGGGSVDPELAGMTARYQDYETGKDVDVYIDHADAGVPYFAVIPETYDSGQNGLTDGRADVCVSAGGKEHYLFTSAGTGTIEFDFYSPGGKGVLLRYRNSTVTAYPAQSSSTSIDVIPGDKILFRIATYKTVIVSVCWKPVVAKPRVYAQGSITPGSSTPVTAVGFTGLTDRSPYSFYGTLPADVQVSEVNPDCILTVTAQGAEHVLIRTRSVTDVAPSLPSGAAWYANQALTGPLTFRLYAGRENAGQNGDMDVWLGTPGVLPDAFSMSQYKAIVKVSTTTLTDRVFNVTRNSLRVISSGQVASHVSPSDYIASDGDRITVQPSNSTVQPSTLEIGGKTYVKAQSRPGLAYTVTAVS